MFMNKLEDVSAKIEEIKAELEMGDKRGKFATGDFGGEIQYFNQIQNELHFAVFWKQGSNRSPDDITFSLLDCDRILRQKACIPEDWPAAFKCQIFVHIFCCVWTGGFRSLKTSVLMRKIHFLFCFFVANHKFKICCQQCNTCNGAKCSWDCSIDRCDVLQWHIEELCTKPHKHLTDTLILDTRQQKISKSSSCNQQGLTDFQRQEAKEKADVSPCCL